jgi:alpha-tubulin suppressor-like RCC1 family protein
MNRKIVIILVALFLVTGYAGQQWSVVGAAGTIPTAIPQVVGIPVTGGVIIASGLGHSCMTTVDNRVLCWGLNDSGQVGDGSTVNRHVAVFVKNITGVVQITLGSKHSCALLSDGTIWCWGENKSGQLGNGTTTNSSIPIQVVGLPDKATGFTAGQDFTCAVLADKSIWCWGDNSSGQLNDGTTTNQTKPVKSLLTALPEQISGGQSTLVGEASGYVSEWTKTQSENILDIQNASNISGNRFAPGGCAVESDNKVNCWTADNKPVLVDGISDALLVGTGLSHGCAVNSSNIVSCWGKNTNGELGDGNTTDQETATQVSNLGAVVMLAVGAHHNCALVANNIAMCWGSNEFGQLGNNSTKNSSIPVKVVMPTK